MTCHGKRKASPGRVRRLSWLDKADVAWLVHSRDPKVVARLGESPRWSWDDAYADMGEAIDAAFALSSAGLLVRVQLSATKDHPEGPTDWEDDRVWPPYTQRSAILAGCEAMRFGP